MQRSVGLIVDCEEVTRAPGMQELVERKIGSQEHGDYVILNLDTGTIPPLHPHTPSAGQRQGRGIKLLAVSVQRRYQTTFRNTHYIWLLLYYYVFHCSVSIWQNCCNSVRMFWGTLSSLPKDPNRKKVYKFKLALLWGVWLLNKLLRSGEFSHWLRLHSSLHVSCVVNVQSTSVVSPSRLRSVKCICRDCDGGMWD